jgi:hypothetical protein
MIFEIIDPKQNCKNIFLENQIIEKPDYDQLSKTWAYHPSLKGYDIRYASLYAQAHSLDECCPDELKDDWERIKQKHFAYIKSFQKGKCEFEDECFYDLVPSTFVMDYFNIKSQITAHVLDNYPKPKNYDFLVDLSQLLSQIKNRKLDINPEVLVPQLHHLRARNFHTKISSCRPVIDYNMFGTITGRLTTYKNSFPILTMNKDYRAIIEPKNDWFIELDFNAAELRCLLALNDEPQPTEDMHTWHGSILNKLSDHNLDRDDIKRKIFGWLYGPLDSSLGIPQIEKYYDKRKALKKYWNSLSEQIINPFGRKIKADEFHALNALIQSTTSDTFLRRAIAVNKLLKNKKSFTSALIHDSMVIDFDKNEKGLLDELIKEFGNTNLGLFKVNASLGTNFGNMRKFR